MGSIKAAVLPAMNTMSMLPWVRAAIEGQHDNKQQHYGCFAPPTCPSGSTGTYVFAHKGDRDGVGLDWGRRGEAEAVDGLQKWPGKVHVGEIYVRHLWDGLIKESAFILLDEQELF